MHMCIDCFFFKAFLPTSRKRLPDRGRWGTTTHCLGMRKLRKGRSKGQRMEMYMYEYLYIIYGDICIWQIMFEMCIRIYIYAYVDIYCNDFICWLSWVWFRSELVWICSFMYKKKHASKKYATSYQLVVTTADAKLQHRVVWGSWSHWSNLSLRWSPIVIFVFHWLHVSFQFNDVSFIIKLKRKNRTLGI